MFSKLEEFFAEWSNESNATKRVIEALSDDSINTRIIPEYRTLGQLSWHIIGTYHEMLSQVGLQFDGPEESGAVPATVSELSNRYSQVCESVKQAMKAQWKDASLFERHNLYGAEWANSITLRVLIQHEVHHRAQMMVLMRLANLRVPGVYGPSREEWAEFGAKAPTL